MSNAIRTAPYVYQPFGSVTHRNRAATGRLFAIGGLHAQTRIEGLTREEADAIVVALAGVPPCEDAPR